MVSPYSVATVFCAKVTYHIDDNYNITTDDIENFDSNGESEPEYSASNGHLTFAEPGKMEFSVDYPLYDHITEKVYKYRIIYSFTRFSLSTNY